MHAIVGVTMQSTATALARLARWQKLAECAVYLTPRRGSFHQLFRVYGKVPNAWRHPTKNSWSFRVVDSSTTQHQRTVNPPKQWRMRAVPLEHTHEGSSGSSEAWTPQLPEAQEAHEAVQCLRWNGCEPRNQKGLWKVTSYMFASGFRVQFNPEVSGHSHSDNSKGCQFGVLQSARLLTSQSSVPPIHDSKACQLQAPNKVYRVAPS